MVLRKPYGDKKIPNEMMASSKNPAEKIILAFFIVQVFIIYGIFL